MVLNNHVINANGDPIAATYKLELLGALEQQFSLLL